GRREHAGADLDRMAVVRPRRQLTFSAEARYQGRVWQLPLPLAGARIADAAALAQVVEDFHRLHERRYFVRSPGDLIEFTEWNVMAIGRAVEARAGAAEARKSAPVVVGRRPMYFRELGGMTAGGAFSSGELAAGDAVPRAT